MSRSIVCATDFSPPSEAAARGACDLARRLGAPVLLVHVHESAAVEPLGADVGAFGTTLAERAQALESSVQSSLRQRLAQQAGELARCGASVSPHLLEPDRRPWDAILDVAAAEDSPLIVLGTHGRRGPRRWLLGSVAERVVRGASCPVLVIPQDQAGTSAWAGGVRNLKVAVALDLHEPAPLEFVHLLRASGPVDVTVLHLYWPPSEIKRRAASSFDVEQPPEGVRKMVEADVRRTVGDLPGAGSLALRVRAEWGRLSDPLLEEAQAAGADLLVVGTHGRNVLAGFAAGSTAMGVLKRIHLPVVFVPFDGRETPGGAS